MHSGNWCGSSAWPAAVNGRYLYVARTPARRQQQVADRRVRGALSGALLERSTGRTRTKSKRPSSCSIACSMSDNAGCMPGWSPSSSDTAVIANWLNGSTWKRIRWRRDVVSSWTRPRSGQRSTEFDDGWRSPRAGKKTPSVLTAIQRLMDEQTAGDLMSARKWTRRTTGQIARELRRLRICISRRTVGRLLHDLKYSCVAIANSWARIRVPTATASSSTSTANALVHPGRGSDDQRRYQEAGIGRQLQESWGQVGSHDRAGAGRRFSLRECGHRHSVRRLRLAAKRGSVQVGVSHDTPCFAVHAIATWWRTEGRVRYLRHERLLILADTGGSNGIGAAHGKRNSSSNSATGMGSP